MKRPLPKHTELYCKLAKRLKLPNPLGRALYIINRLHNGDWHYDFHYPVEDRLNYDLKVLVARRMDMIRRMKAIRPETATKWLKHWNNGGAIRQLMSQKEFNQKRKQYRADQKAYQGDMYPQGLGEKS